MTILDRFLDVGYVYRFEAGPDVARSADEARRRGINCVSLAHLVVRELTGFVLPSDLKCYEMYRDTKYFRDVGATAMRLGDLVWLGEVDPVTPIKQFVPQYDRAGYMVNWPECGLNHLAIATGETVENDPLLLHASPHEGTNVLWTLGQFSQHPRYASVYRVARLDPELAAAEAMVQYRELQEVQ